MACVRYTYIILPVISFLIKLSVTSDPLQELLFNGKYKFIDLSHTYNNETVYWPNAQRFEFTKKIEQKESQDSYWYASNDFVTGEHGGTHIDAPYHFYQPGKYVDELPLEKLIVPLVLVDVSAKVNGNPDFILYKKDLDIRIAVNFEKPCLVLFKFGWSQYYNNPQKYLGSNGTTLNFPGLSAEVAEWITSYKNIVGVGVDVASVDAGASTDFPVHKILSKAGLYNLEHVNIHTPISENKCTAMALPMKIGFGTGAPLRLVAICPEEIKQLYNEF